MERATGLYVDTASLRGAPLVCRWRIPEPHLGSLPLTIIIIRDTPKKCK